MRYRLTTTSVAACALVIAGSAVAQVVATQPTQRPSTSLIDVTTSAPRVAAGGYATMLLKVRSLTGEPLPVAVLMGKNNWSAYSSNGAICQGDQINATGVPWYSPHDGRLDGPIGIQAGVKSPALVPVTLCYAMKRGDEVSINVVFFAIKDGRPIPQQFSFSRLVIQ